ncbi:MAG: M1 family peptidase [Bdellovibrionales bacterium]|nr:M1 family peptidase [Bdellovibrionales bacterium]
MISLAAVGDIASARIAPLSTSVELSFRVDSVTRTLSGKAHYTVDLLVGQVLSLDLGPELSVKLSSALVSGTEVPASSGSRDLRVTALENVTGFDVEFIADLSRSSEETGSVLNADGLVLFGGLSWYPRPLGVHTLQVAADLPSGWSSVTSGTLMSSVVAGSNVRETWTVAKPQEGLDWVAGPYSVEKVLHRGIEISTHFHTTDATLARSYLNVIPGFIDHYESEIAPYPYTGFAVVENMWETGYGMGGFTLLGPSVIRLPFIFTSSLPHEVLHNWWGNSVYVDYASGNWCEGLTTYMADHWQQSLTGQDGEYRRNSLARFSDYAVGGRDFPLRDFRGRHSASTQTVGYDKSMMLFHMLKTRVGDVAFKRALQTFYRDNLYRQTTWSDLELAFEAASSTVLDGFFAQWLDRKGLARLTLAEARQSTAVLSNGQSGYRTCVKIQQDPSSLYDLNIPVEFTLADGSTSRSVVSLTTAETTSCLESAQVVHLVAVDPRFEVFRELTREERPPALSGVLAGDPIVVQYDSSAGVDSAIAQGFADAWSGTVEGRVSVLDRGGSAVTTGSTGTLVLLGDSASHRQFIEPLLRTYGVTLNAGHVSIDGTDYDLSRQFVALAMATANGQSVLWVAGPMADVQAVSELSSRLTHYGKFGALVFEGRKNLVKKVWPVVGSALQAIPDIK